MWLNFIKVKIKFKIYYQNNNYIENLKSYYEDALEIETDFVADEKEILADYGGKEASLIKKAKTKDEKALDALADLRNLEMQRTKDLRELDRKTEDFDKALKVKRMIEVLNEDEDVNTVSSNELISDELNKEVDEFIEKNTFRS